MSCGYYRFCFTSSSATYVTSKFHPLLYQCFIVIFNTFSAESRQGNQPVPIASDWSHRHWPYSNQIPTACGADALSTRPPFASESPNDFGAELQGSKEEQSYFFLCVTSCSLHLVQLLEECISLELLDGCFTELTSVYSQQQNSLKHILYLLSIKQRILCSLNAEKLL